MRTLNDRILPDLVDSAVDRELGRRQRPKAGTRGRGSRRSPRVIYNPGGERNDYANGSTAPPPRNYESGAGTRRNCGPHNTSGAQYAAQATTGEGDDTPAETGGPPDGNPAKAHGSRGNRGERGTTTADGETHNLTTATLPHCVHRLLHKGLRFALRPPPTAPARIHEATAAALRRVALKDYFSKPSLIHPLLPRPCARWNPPMELMARLLAWHQEYRRHMDGPKRGTGTRQTGTYLPSKVFFNLTRREKNGLRWLQQTRTTLCIQADKNLGICVISKGEYERRLQAELDLNPDAYARLPYGAQTLHRRREQTFRRISAIISDINPRMMGRKIHEYILEPTQQPFQISTIRGLPKIHKPGTRIRLVYPFKHHPLGNLHRFLAKALEPATLRIPSVITNVLEVVKALSGRVVHPDTWFCTADIQTMYPSTDRAQAIAIAASELAKPEYACFASNSADRWRALLNLAHSDLEFEYKGSLYECVRGVQIGSPVAPPLAVFALHSHLSGNWTEIQKVTLYGGTYFDDALFLLHHQLQKQQVHQMIQDLLQGTTLAFDPASIVVKRMKELVSQSQPFLDILIGATEHPQGIRCHVQAYAKPMGAYHYIHWTSAHPPSTKRGW